MKSSALFVLLITAAAGQAEVGVVPERFALDRYAKLKGEAPFAVKSEEEKPAEQKIDWADSYYLSGAAKYTDNGVEKDWVYLNHKSDPSASFQLYGNEPGKDQIQIVKLDWHPENPLLTEVHLKKGTEFAIVKRDRAGLTAAAQQPPPGAPRPGQPMPTGVPGAGAIRQPGVQPRNNAPVIPRPTGAAVPAPQTFPQPATGAQPNTQGNDRRRIRVINR
jgi:hypothetical protein